MKKKKEDIKKVVLAYSGGLDTSIIIPWLKENYNNCEVVAVSGDVGQGTELDGLEEKALKTGASKLYVLDLKKDYVENYIWPCLKADAKYEEYLLGTSHARPCIAKALAEIAKKENADAICHGCTGKGNDQVRFEVSIASIDPTLKAISPIRDLSLTRDVEIAFAKEHKLPITQTEKSPYSIDQNVWGRAIETGFLEDPWNGPTKDCYSYTDDPAFPPVEDEVVIEFKQGIPVKIDGHDVTPLQAIEEMNRRAGAQGIGRIDLIEDRLVGIKSRELYEAPGAIALITAHQELENCCLEREQHRIKRDIDKRWAELVYDAQWFSPATQSLNAFIEDTQKYVSGEIRMILHGGRAVVTGRRSNTSLYDYNLATYDSGDSFDQKSSNGFIDIYGLQDELTPEVEDKDVTVRRADLQREIKSLLSYAVGCLFGRYSLDEKGLCYAGGEWDASKYKTILPVKDNVLPICDDDYLESDLTGKIVEFVKIVYGEDTLEENLKFIADALGTKGATPREAIRNYLLNGFYADHCKIYQKRPIYWLFSSGKKNAFKALVYMHRWEKTTVATVRTDYVHELQERYRTQLSMLGDQMEHAAQSERVKLKKRQEKLTAQLDEINAYEEKVHHLADRMMDIDLDDGVKVNYAKFAEILEKIK